MNPPPLQVLVVDDNRTAADAIAALLRREGHQVQVCFDGMSAIQAMHAGWQDLVLTDLRMEPVDGLQVVRAARAMSPPREVMVFTAFGSVETAVEAMRLGAADFLTKPVAAEQILNRVRAIRPLVQPSAPVLGSSPAAMRLWAEAEASAAVRSSVLILGEPGTGRRHLARWLHAHGPDAASELRILRPGQVEEPAALADLGSLLLVGLDGWSREALASLGRLLEGWEAGQPPRLLATAAPAIELQVARGEFPAELYFRLAVLILRVPPLRARIEDLPALLDHFLAQHARAMGRPSPKPSAAQLSALQRHAWPGNLREVANLAERAVILGPGSFDLGAAARPLSDAGEALGDGFNLQEHLEAIEKQVLERAIQQTDGDRPAMSRLLGIERNTLRYKLNKYNLLDRG